MDKIPGIINHGHKFRSFLGQISQRVKADLNRISLLFRCLVGITTLTAVVGYCGPIEISPKIGRSVRKNKDSSNQE